MSQNIPTGKQQFFDVNGKPLVGGQVFNYIVSTTTPKNTYQDSALTVLNANPVILDARGQASMYGNGSYRQVLMDSTGVTIWDQVILDVGASTISDLANSVDMTKGIGLIPSAARVVGSISILRSLPKTGASIYAFVEGSSSPGDGGGGNYYLDASDTTSTDNGYSVIVASDGGRWKLSTSDQVIKIDSIAALRAVSQLGIRSVLVTGYYARLDGGGGTYLVDPTDTTTADNGGTVIVGASGQRFKLVYLDKISVKQFGAKGDYNKTSDTGTDDTVAINKAHATIPAGVEVFYPLGLYLVTSTIVANGGSNIKFQSRATSTNEAKCALVGSLTLDGVINIQANDSTFSSKAENMVVMRRPGSFTNTVRGIILSGTDQTVLVDCSALNHGIAIHVNGQLAPYMLRLNTWNCSGAHVKISTCVEPRFTNCRFGRNGGADQTCDSYVLIDGSGGIQVDTVEFLGCQFNQSGANANSVIRFINYSNPNGIFGFTDCHLEAWGTYVLGIDSTTTRLQRVKLNGCTITSSGSQFIGGNMQGVLEDFQLNGCTTAAIVTFDQVTSASIVGGSLAGGLVVNAGNTIIVGLKITGNVTLAGSVGKCTFMSSQISGSVTDTFTGTRSISGNI